MQTCSILGMPVETGAGRRGCLMGPDALRTAGLAETLGTLGIKVTDLGNLYPPAPVPMASVPDNLVRLGETVAWTRTIHDAAYDVARSGSFPIFVGGDHSMAAGTLTAVARAAADQSRPLFVLWLDAHPDLNTLDTTVSGHLHGTPMAYALGLGGFEGRFARVAHPIDPARVCMIGLRSIDPPERALISELGIKVWDMRRIDEEGIKRPVTRFLEQVVQEDGLLHVSFDVDFLDPTIAPAVGTTVPGGATFREAHLIMELLADSGRVSSFELTELNPYLDIGGKTADLMTDLVASLMGKRVLDRPSRHDTV